MPSSSRVADSDRRSNTLKTLFRSFFEKPIQPSGINHISFLQTEGQLRRLSVEIATELIELIVGLTWIQDWQKPLRHTLKLCRRGGIVIRMNVVCPLVRDVHLYVSMRPMHSKNEITY